MIGDTVHNQFLFNLRESQPLIVVHALHVGWEMMWPPSLGYIIHRAYWFILGLLMGCLLTIGARTSRCVVIGN